MDAFNLELTVDRSTVVIILLVLVRHTDKVNPFLDKYRPIAFISRKSPITQCNYSVTNLNY
jgi:hypothetical protein